MSCCYFYLLCITLNQWNMPCLSRVNDCLVRVNNVDLTNVEYNTAMQVISGSDILNMVSSLEPQANLFTEHHPTFFYNNCLATLLGDIQCQSERILPNIKKCSES